MAKENYLGKMFDNVGIALIKESERESINNISTEGKFRIVSVAVSNQTNNDIKLDLNLLSLPDEDSEQDKIWKPIYQNIDEVPKRGNKFVTAIFEFPNYELIEQVCCNVRSGGKTQKCLFKSFIIKIIIY